MVVRTKKDPDIFVAAFLIPTCSSSLESFFVDKDSFVLKSLLGYDVKRVVC